MMDIKKALDALCDSYELEIYTLYDMVGKIRNIHVGKPDYVGSLIPCIVCNEILPCKTLRILDGEQ